MMSRDLGGIQQAYIDYNEALTMQKHEVINITSVSAQINKQLLNNYSLPNIAPWCFLSKLYLWILAIIHKPDLIICHGNRAVSFASAYKQKNLCIIGVSHNYSYKHLYKCDYILVLTSKLKEHLIQHGINKQRLLSIPNMTRVMHEYKTVPIYKSPIIIGSFGRFVHKKGFIYLIEAIKLLKQDDHNVQLLLGGDGPEKNFLVQKTKELELEEDIKFYGWVDDKDIFFQKIDLFCLPSTIEPFGIILLEAMEHSKPIIATKSGGPEEIIRNNLDGLLTEIESSQDLADKLLYAINNHKKTEQLAQSAHARLKENYDIKVVSKKLSEILGAIK
jgi:glycosyltransferase involved in cell wall biosynthesis